MQKQPPYISYDQGKKWEQLSNSQLSLVGNWSHSLISSSGQHLLVFDATNGTVIGGTTYDKDIDYLERKNVDI